MNACVLQELQVYYIGFYAIIHRARVQLQGPRWRVIRAEDRVKVNT